jgi:hypothetical protein
MTPPIRTAVRSALAILLLASAVCSLSSCSTDDVNKHQQGISDIHQGMIDRREARQQARDERFRASRESWMN